MARQKRISKADMETCVKRNLASVQDYRNWLAAEGYDDQSALLHELLLSDEINDATEAAKRKAKIAADKAAAAAKKLADDAAAALKKQTELDAGVPFLSGIETAVVQGLMPIEKYRAAVVAKGASADVVAALVAVVNGKREAWLAAEQKRQDAIARAANKGISLAKLESAVMAGILTIADYDTRLQLDGFNDADVQILHNLLQAKMGAKAAADVLHATAIGTAAAKGLSLSEADAAVLDGTWTLTDYSGWLTSHGWNDLDAAVLTSHVAAQLAARQAAQAARDALVAKQLDKGLSLGQIETAVIKGVRTLDDYRAFLVAQHYDADAQSTLVDLLQQKIDAHGAATATRDAVKTATASKTFTLDQEERAVLVGALTLADYRDYLTRAGYGPEDVAALTGLLVDRLAAWGAAKTLLDQVDATASAAGLDLGALESDVLDGTSTIDDYTAALRGLGVADADVATLTDVLQQRVTAAGDAAQLAAGIDAALKLKQLSLSQWDAAVLDGLRTTDDYSAFLLAQGYAPSDAGVLVAIVQRKLDAQAGKRKA
jgi:hypothetical protein